MITYSIPTGQYDLTLKIKITVKKPMIFTIKGFDANPLHTNSIYFRRAIGTKDKLFSGEHIMLTPLPISPNQLNVVVFDSETKSDEFVVIDSIVPKPHTRGLVAFNSPDDQEFFKFAEDFCKACGYLGANIYRSENNKFEIKLSDVIYEKGGNISSTPARVFRPYGNIEVSKQQFDGMTIPMRILILLHEYSHFRAKTSNEETADNYALNMYLGMGYPKSEAVFAFTNVFKPIDEKHGEALAKRTDKLMSFIRNYNG